MKTNVKNSNTVFLSVKCKKPGGTIFKEEKKINHICGSSPPI